MGSTIEVLLEADDLAETVFACSPLIDAALSLRVWKTPGLHPEHVAGLRQLRSRYETLDTDLLGALVATNHHRAMPDFLTPRPAVYRPIPVLSSRRYGTPRQVWSATTSSAPTTAPRCRACSPGLVRTRRPCWAGSPTSSSRTGEPAWPPGGRGCGHCWRLTSPTVAVGWPSAGRRHCSPTLTTGFPGRTGACGSH